MNIDHKVANDSHMQTLLVNLNDTETVSGVERNAGLAVLRLILVRGDQKLVTFLHLEAKGFELDDKRGLTLVLAAATSAGEESVRLAVNPAKCGFDAKNILEG